MSVVIKSYIFIETVKRSFARNHCHCRFLFCKFPKMMYLPVLKRGNFENRCSADHSELMRSVLWPRKVKLAYRELKALFNRRRRKDLGNCEKE